MATSKRIVTTDLDFDQIKQNLKTYLRAQDQFTDYDFEGSGLSILLDVLAYNTHYNALHLNLAINEAFLDSAVKRNSVVSKAKELGYVPMSAKSAIATVNVQMLNDRLDAPQTMEIGRYTPFTARQGSEQYNFYTQQSYLTSKQGNQYVFENVELREGTPVANTYIWADGVEIIIPNTNADLSTLRVTVQESTQSSLTTIFKQADSFLEITDTSTVYFIKEIENGLYQVEFGNGVVGKSLEPGNVVLLEYMVTSAEIANGAYVFQYNGGAINNTQIFTSTTQSAFGGSSPESIDSIKWNAPRSYAAQNRCVTLDDYKSIIYRLYPNVKSVNVWGGEQNNPPSYGDVFISVRPDNAETLSDAEKSYILNDVIGPRKLVTMHPKFVDPVSINVQLDVAFYYDPTLTNRNANDISSLVRTAIASYDDKVLNRFGSVLKYSNLNRVIDVAEDSIVSSITTIKLHRAMTPIYNRQEQYVVSLGNPIYNSGVPEESVMSTGIYVLNVPQIVYFDDIPQEDNDVGQIRMFYYVKGKKTTHKIAGRVYYSTGVIELDNIVITGLAEENFKFIIKPQSNDVVSVRSEIVSIPTELVTITPVIERGADKYKFTSSRN